MKGRVMYQSQLSFLADKVNDKDSLELQHQLKYVLCSAIMVIHKQCSNDRKNLDKVPLNQEEFDFDKTKNNSVKTLGLRQDTNENNFYFNVSICVDTH